MNISLKRFFLGFFTLFCISIFSFPAQAAPKKVAFTKMVFFGDSLTDNGNLYRDLFKLLPKSPPYFEGRFSNGPVWSEYVSDYYQKNHNMTPSNYALGGEAVLLEDREHVILPYDLETSVDLYLVRTTMQKRSDTLFVIWVGENDYMQGSDNVDAHTNDVIQGLESQMDKLISHGARHFLLINLPAITKSPYGFSAPVAKQIKQLVDMHNVKLVNLVAKYGQERENVEVKMFDVATIFDALVDNPEGLNTKYNTGINDVVDPCWEGGFTLKMANVSEAGIEQQLADQIKKLGAAKMSVDTQAYAKFIAKTPGLRDAYLLGQQATQGAASCVHPENYLFWDHMHPTTTAHRILAGEIIEYIDKTFMM